MNLGAGQTVYDPLLPFTDMAVLGRNTWWRYVLAMVILLLAVVLSTAVVAGAVSVWGIVSGYEGQALLDGSMFGEFGREEPLLFLVMALLSVAVYGPVMYTIVRWIHKRPWRTVITGRRAFAWRRVALAYGALTGLLLLALLLDVAFYDHGLRVTFDPGVFFPMLPVIVILTLGQVFAEEVVFRGYVLQWVGLLTRIWIIRLVVPAALFFAAHLGNVEAELGGIWARLDYALIALYLTFLAMRGNGLEDSLGTHLAVNLFVFLVVGVPGSTVSGPAILALDTFDYQASFVATIAIFPIHFWILYLGPWRRNKGAGSAP